MAIERREQVFLSSTFKDLVEERRAVIQTLLEADCIPSGMELFPASDREKWELIKGVIDLCDYYVVIVGGRYGSVDAAAKLSYTEMEFDYAVETNKPVMGFLHGNPGQLPGDKLELDAELRKRLGTFREKVERRVVKYWNNPGDLPGQVALAMMQIRKSHPAVGWIRASEAMTPAIKSELAELRAKVRELSADLHEEQRQHADVMDPSDLVQGDEEAHLDCIIEFHWQRDIDSGDVYSYNRARSAWTVIPSWDDIVKHLGPDLMDEASEDHLRERLSILCKTLARAEIVQEREGEAGDAQSSPEVDVEIPNDAGEAEGDDRVGEVHGAKVTTESFNDVKIQLLALGLIEPGMKRRTSSDANTYWRLTERGHQKVLRLRAIRKTALTG